MTKTKLLPEIKASAKVITPKAPLQPIAGVKKKKKSRLTENTPKTEAIVEGIKSNKKKDNKTKFTENMLNSSSSGEEKTPTKMKTSKKDGELIGSKDKSPKIIKPLTKKKSPKKSLILSRSPRNDAQTNEETYTQAKTPKQIDESNDLKGEAIVSNVNKKSKRKRKPRRSKAKKSPENDSKYTLFVGKLGFDISPEELKEHFSKVANITNVRWPTFADSGRRRDFAFIQAATQDDYENAVSLNKSHLKGHLITVEYTMDGAKNSVKRQAIIKAKTLKLRKLSEDGIIGSKKSKTKKVIKSEDE